MPKPHIRIAALLAVVASHAWAQSVVINEFRNSTPEAIELVVVSNNLDLRGMLLKDYSSSGSGDGGGAYIFANHALWSSVRAGTIVVLRRDGTAADVTAGGADYNLDVGLLNATYFSAGSGSFDIAGSEIVQIKASGSPQASFDGAIHTFATTSSNAAQFVVAPVPKLRGPSGGSGTDRSAEATTPNSVIGDYNGAAATGSGAAGSIGTWNTAANQVFIEGLRGGGGGTLTNAEFIGSSASASEASVAYTVTVRKTVGSGNVSGQVRLGGTAALGVDYSVNTTNFTMNGATTSATFIVAFTNDVEVEGAETLVLTITNVTGGGIGSPSVFTLTITDDEVPPVAPEGILQFRFNTPPYLAVTTNDENIVVSDMALSAGTIEQNITTLTVFPDEPYVEETGGWTASSQAAAKHYLFTITPDEDFQVSITAITFRAYASAAGPSSIGYKIGDGLATFEVNAPDSALVVVSQTVVGVVNQTGTVTVQIQGWTNGSRSTSGAGIFKLDDVVVFGTVSTIVPNPPVLLPLTNKALLVGGSVSFAVSAIPTDGDPVTLTATTNNAPGSVFGATNQFGTFTWTPALMGFFKVIFTASDKDGSVSRTVSISVTGIPGPVANVWINELHYDNSPNPDIDEGVEIAGVAGTDLSTYSIFLYDGNIGGGAVYTNRLLSGVIPNEGSGYGAVWSMFGPSAGFQGRIQNGGASGTGDADGVALVKDGATVLQFISYEGVVVGKEGPANGLTSTDILVSEGETGTNITPVGYSLQVCGTGTGVADFVWTKWQTNSMGLLNGCQIIGAGGGGGNDADGDGMPDDWETMFFGGTTNNAYGDFDGDGFYNIEEFVAFTDPANSASYLRIVAVTNASGAMVVVPSVTGRQYRLLSSPLLPAQAWTNVIAGPVPGTGGNLAIGAGGDATTTAVRVRVNLP